MQFFTLIIIWHGANISANNVSSTERLIIPLKRKITDGITDSDSARNRLFLRKHTAQIMQYAAVITVLAIRYTAKALSDQKPIAVYGIFIIIVAKQPYLPICSKVSTALLLHVFTKPSLHFMAKIMLGIIITAIKARPYGLNQVILLLRFQRKLIGRIVAGTL